MKHLMSPLLLASLLGCSALTTAQDPQIHIIPEPAKVQLHDAPSFVVSSEWGVSGHAATKDAFQRMMRGTQSLQFNGQDGGDGPKIHFALSGEVAGQEAYKLTASDDGILVKASSASGLYYGAVTVWQMLSATKGDSVELPVVTIEDKPRFGWRGIMLDEARHFQGIEFVKKMIDWMGLHKLNRFQWHLVDDQGWRIEIKKYPKLTEKAAWRVPAGDAARADIDPKTGAPRLMGGFYTQEDIREVVAYAAERHITVVPEIDLPGHVQGTVATYPQLGVDQKAGPVLSDWGIYPHTFNLEAETFIFLEDVLLEVMGLFPSDYIHIGGDEVQKAQWANDPRTQERMKELGIESVDAIQSYFTRHFDNFLNSHGRKMIGWDEILEGGEIHKTATVMSWRGEKGGVEAAHKGHTVIMSPWPTLYLDMHQSTSGREPTGRPALSSLSPLETVYHYQPVPEELKAKGADFVLGAQGNIWTEHMRTNWHVMHNTFPRMSAVAEVVWRDEGRDFEGFLEKLPAQLYRYEKLGIGYADVAFEVIPAISKDGEKRTITLSNQTGFGDIRYTLDGSPVTPSSPLYTGAIEATAGQQLTASSFKGDQILTKPTVLKLDRVSLSVRTDDALKVCEPGYHLKLDDDYPRGDVRPALEMNIIDPCWIYQSADLEGVETIDIEVGQVPFNFQIGDDWKQVSFDTPRSEAGELNIYKGTCAGNPILSLSLEQAAAHPGITKLSAQLPAGTQSGDLCFRFAQKPFENGGKGRNLYGIERVTLR